MAQNKSNLWKLGFTQNQQLFWALLKTLDPARAPCVMSWTDRCPVQYCWNMGLGTATTAAFMLFVSQFPRIFSIISSRGCFGFTYKSCCHYLDTDYYNRTGAMAKRKQYTRP
jgi:hypothetical protein